MPLFSGIALSCGSPADGRLAGTLIHCVLLRKQTFSLDLVF